MLLTKKLSVGNRILDAEHQKLHRLIAIIANAINAGDDGVLPECFERLEEAMQAYFSVMECITYAVGFDSEQQQMAHRNLLESVRKIRSRLFVERSLSRREKNFLANALSDQLVQHILFDCKPLKLVLDTHYYDFRPDNLSLA